LLLALASIVILGSESRGTHDHILLPQIRDSYRNRVARLYPRALGSLFVTFYDPQGIRWRYSNPPDEREVDSIAEE
jgi:hypothetical protein